MKRKSDASAPASSYNGSPQMKRVRVNNDFHKSSQGQSGARRARPNVDATSGQTSAFPGLDLEDQDTDFGSDAADDEDETSTRAAMRYLRSVRSEAKGIPSLLVAPKIKTGTSDDTEHETVTAGNGYYEDGAYVAAPILGPVMPNGWKERYDAAHDGAELVVASTILPSPQEIYTRQLLASYKTQRRHLTTLRKRSGVSPDIHFRGGFKALSDIVFKLDPNTKRVAALSQETVLDMLRVASHFLKRNRNLSPRLGEWLWALLCAFGDVGTLDSDAVSIVRELAKKAIWVGVGYIGAEEANATADYDQHVDTDDAEHIAGDNTANDSASRTMNQDSLPRVSSDVQENHGPQVQSRGSRRRNTSSPDPPSPHVLDVVQSQATSNDSALLDEARNRMLQSIEPVPELATRQSVAPPETHDSEVCPNMNTCATLDMIITIAGEVYGQRDLLEFRTVWSGLWG